MAIGGTIGAVLAADAANGYHEPQAEAAAATTDGRSEAEIEAAKAELNDIIWSDGCRAIIALTFAKPATDVEWYVNSYGYKHAAFVEEAHRRGYRHYNEVYQACGGTIV